MKDNNLKKILNKINKKAQFLNNSLNNKQSRYRALVPIDVYIEETGDENIDKDTAYSKMKEQLEKMEGCTYQLSFSDIEKTSFGKI